MHTFDISKLNWAFYEPSSEYYGCVCFTFRYETVKYTVYYDIAANFFRSSGPSFNAVKLCLQIPIFLNYLEYQEKTNDWDPDGYYRRYTKE